MKKRAKHGDLTVGDLMQYITENQIGVDVRLAIGREPTIVPRRDADNGEIRMVGRLQPIEISESCDGDELMLVYARKKASKKR